MKIIYVWKISYCCNQMKDQMQMGRICHFENKVIFNRHLTSGDSFEEELKYCPFCGKKIEIDCIIEDEMFKKK